MRRTAHGFLAAVLACILFAVTGCSSASKSSTTDDNVATPDGSFCSLLVAFRASNASLDAEFNSGDTDRAKAAMSRWVDQIDLLRRKAPPEIKVDVDAVAAYATSLDKLLAEYGYDLDAFVGNEDASTRFLALKTESVDSSQLQLQTYAETECAAEGGTASTTTVVP